MDQPILLVLVLALMTGAGWAQSDSTQASGGDAQQTTSAPAPAFGQSGTSAVDTSENPPVTGLDQPSLEPRGAGRSYLIPGVHVSEAADSNISGTNSTSSYGSVTSLLGSLTLQKLWPRSDLALDYLGGGTFYDRTGLTATQVHTLLGEDRFLWRNGQFVLRDSFNYLPEGSFGYGSYGGAGAIAGVGGGLGGIGGAGGISGGVGGSQLNFFGPGQFASITNQPRISNVTIADITQLLSPRSSVTATGSYGLVHFVNNPVGYVNSRQIALQGGYTYQINRSDQIGLLYGYQQFKYPSILSGDITTNLVNAVYGHRISGRMDLSLGGGPQFTKINSPLLGNSTRLSASGRASLRYRFPKTSVGLYYDHYNTSGSGFFVGASTDVARLTASRPISKNWLGTADFGYTRSSRLVPVVILLSPVNSAETYGYFYAGLSAHRQLGKDFSLFGSYQFNDVNFDRNFCGNTVNCSNMFRRNVAVIGLDWHPHPIRLD
jgi:hypothetical protein